MAVAFARTVILYALIIIGIRLMGKKQVGELEPTELVFAMLISDLAAVPMQDFGIPLLFGMVPIIALLSITMILSVLSLKSIRFRNLICGRPSVVMEHGSILQDELSKNRFTVDELLEELRLQGVSDLSTVKYAILENSGRLSVMLYANQQPVTPAQMQLPVEDEGLPLIIISGGRVLRENLKQRNLDQKWLQKQLAEHNQTSPSEVFLLTVDESGSTYYVPKELGCP